MDQLIKTLRVAFASQYSYLLNAQNFHWNVEGADFSQYHNLFGRIYEEVQESIDDFAENIRKLGAYTPANFASFENISLIKNVTSDPPPAAMDMVAMLMEDSVKMAELCGMVVELSEQNKQYGLTDFLSGRQDAFKKHEWMLKSTLK